MKSLFTVGLLLVGAISMAQSGNLKPGSPAPGFNLKNVNGEMVSFASFKEAKGYIVIFTCNTCPYAKAYEERIIDINTKYAALGFPVIAINTNDPDVSAGDSFADMVARSKSRNFNFPYLFDDGQKITTAYGASKTPTVFLVKNEKDGNLIVYTGAIDNDPDGDKSSPVNYIQQAVTAVQEGKEPAVASTKAIGCSVKRKKSS